MIWPAIKLSQIFLKYVSALRVPEEGIREKRIQDITVRGQPRLPAQPLPRPPAAPDTAANTAAGDLRGTTATAVCGSRTRSLSRPSDTAARAGAYGYRTRPSVAACGYRRGRPTAACGYRRGAPRPPAAIGRGRCGGRLRRSDTAAAAAPASLGYDRCRGRLPLEDEAAEAEADAEADEAFK